MVQARIVLGFLLVLVAGLALPAPAHACSCIRPDTSSIALQHADRVFVGRVDRVDGLKPYPIWADLDPRRAVIDDEVFIRVTGFRASK